MSTGPELVDDGVPPPDGRPLAGVAWGALAVTMTPPALAFLFVPPTRSLLPFFDYLPWVGGGAVAGMGLLHVLGLFAGVVLGVRWLGRERTERTPIPALAIAAPALAHLAALAVAKSVLLARFGTAGLAPIEAWIQWWWVAPTVAWFARDGAGPLGVPRAAALLCAASLVVAAADATVLTFLLLLGF